VLMYNMQETMSPVFSASALGVHICGKNVWGVVQLFGSGRTTDHILCQKKTHAGQARKMQR
jgi:hypothetical protein